MKSLARWTLLLGMLVLAGCFGQQDKADSAKQAVNQWRGQWLVINYWAPWCGPCHREIPQLNQLQQRLKGHKVQLVGVNFDGLEGDELAKAAKQMHIEFKVLAEDPAKALGLPRPQGLPMTYVLDTQGKLQAQLAGEQTKAGLTGLLTRLGAL